MKFSIMTLFKTKKNAVMKSLYEMQSASSRIDMILAEMDEKYKKLKNSYRDICISVEKLADAKNDTNAEAIDMMLVRLNDRKNELKSKIENYKETAKTILEKKEYAVAQINALETLASIQKEVSESLFDNTAVDANAFLNEIDSLVKAAEINLKVETELAAI